MRTEHQESRMSETVLTIEDSEVSTSRLNLNLMTHCLLEAIARKFVQHLPSFYD